MRNSLPGTGARWRKDNGHRPDRALLRPQQAAVLGDGSDLRKVTRSWVASQLGVVFRDTFLFDASVADNLRYARPEAADAGARSHARSGLGAIPFT
jgi:ABC-type multidrug transport system fused ATPase/permease subunit